MDIQQIVKTPGWRDIKAMFESIANEELKAISTTQTPEQIATQYIAHVKAKQIIKRTLARIEKITTETEHKPISYK